MNLQSAICQTKTSYGKMRKQMREITYNDYKQHEGLKTRSGTVERFDQRFIYESGTLWLTVTPRPNSGESFKSHDVIDVYAYKVETTLAENNA